MDESGAQDETVKASSTDLSHEFVRIDEEKERLRRLADQLGLKQTTGSGPETPPQPRAMEPQRSPDEESGARRAGRSRKVHSRRPSLSLSRIPAQPASPRRPAIGTADGWRRPDALLESLSGFVPVALFDEMKRERDELFFRLTKVEVERPQIEKLRGALTDMELEVKRLETEIQRRRRSPATGPSESLRLCYRRWLMLRRCRELMFSDYMACRRTDRDEV